MPDTTHDRLIDRQFAPLAQAYLTSAVHAQGPDLELMHSLVAPGRFTRALDLGCGGGHATYALAPLVAEVIAYDLSSSMLNLVQAQAATRGLRNVTIQQGAAQRLPFPDAHVDLVVTRYSAHHWQDLATCMQEARRVLKPGGCAILMDVIVPPEALLDSWLQCLELMRDPSHVRDYALGEWTTALTAAGLRPEPATTFRLRLDFRTWVARMNTPQPQVQAISALLRQAPAEVARHFAIEPEDGGFTIDTMLILAR